MHLLIDFARKLLDGAATGATPATVTARYETRRVTRAEIQDIFEDDLNTVPRW